MDGAVLMDYNVICIGQREKNRFVPSFNQSINSIWNFLFLSIFAE